MRGEETNIATFELLAHRAGLNLNDPANLRVFAYGLPRTLAEQCSPEPFSQWAHAAQRQQKNDIKIVSIQGDDYDNGISRPVEKSQPGSTKKWGWKRTKRTGRTWRVCPNLTMLDHLISS